MPSTMMTTTGRLLAPLLGSLILVLLMLVSPASAYQLQRNSLQMNIFSSLFKPKRQASASHILVKGKRAFVPLYLL